MKNSLPRATAAAAPGRAPRPWRSLCRKDRGPEFARGLHLADISDHGSQNGTLWNIGPGLPGHSGLMFAERITLAHFSVSSAMYFPNSAGEPGSTVLPRSARRAVILGSAR